MDKNLISELIFSFSRSTGPGGQNVNKVNTKVELRFNIMKSVLLSEMEKEKLFLKLNNRISNDGFLILTEQRSRSQLKNKTVVLERFYGIIEKALTPEAKRIPTKASFSSKLRRLSDKQKRSDKKVLRKPPEHI